MGIYAWPLLRVRGLRHADAEEPHGLEAVDLQAVRGTGILSVRLPFVLRHWIFRLSI